MTELTPMDVAKIRLNEMKELGIEKSLRAIYLQVVKEFNEGTIPSIIKTVTSNRRTYRYTTLKMLKMKETKEINQVTALLNGTRNKFRKAI